jgi:thiol:disulfide interchange protein DsbC
MNKLLVILTLLFTISCSKSDATIDEARKSLEKQYPNIQISSIIKIDQDFFEVKVGEEIYYLTLDLKHLIAGNIIEMSTGNNITENSYNKTRLDYLSQISDDDVILYSSDNSKHTLTIFSDTSCPYCQKLHNEIDNLISNQVSVKYVLFSRNGSDNDAYNDMVSVWCSKDKKKSLDELFDGSFIEPKTCDNPIDSNYTKAMNLKVNGTPMIFFSDGSVIPGYVSSDKIIEALMSKN